MLRFLGRYFFQEHQISAGQLSANRSSTKLFYCLISVQWLDVVDKIATLSRISGVLNEHLETNI